MSHIQPPAPSVFTFKDASVRVVQKDGEPWWFALDVCRILGLSDTNKALLNLEEDEKTEHEQYSGSGRKPILVNEPGLYSLILRSRKPEAKAFKRWVTHEVLPQIRKTGGYRIPQTFADALQLAADFQRKLEEQKPKADFYDAVIDSKDTVLIGDVAKNLQVPGMGPVNLFRYLRNRKVLKPDNLPYQQYIELGWFRVVEQKYDKSEGKTGIAYRTRVYQRGVDGIQRLLRQDGLL